jgi:signal transduction histidine kinase
MHAPNVLVVEDDTALSTLVACLLTEAGYTPVTIANHALIDAAVDEWRPKCVILDGEIRSTGESRTWDDAAAIRRKHPALPVLMFTADGAALAEAQAGLSTRSLAAGFAGIVAKPFVVEEFLATVKSAVERPVELASASSPSNGDPTLPIRVFPDVARIAADWPDADVLGTIVHELRSPLTVIRGQVQFALRHIGGDPERGRTAMNSAIAQVDRMGRLISELLDHTGLESNGLSLNVVEFDLVAALVEAIRIHEYGTTTRIVFAKPAHPVRVYADPVRIAQILDNLLNNAIKYSAVDAPITVSLAIRGKQAQISVADHGVGVPEAEGALIFTPFYRASTARDVRGTGLGLHISRRLAERHSGRLWLEASSNAGSVFTLALPIPSTPAN